MLWKFFLFWNVFLLVNLVDSYSKRKPKDGKREKVEKVVRKSESRGKKMISLLFYWFYLVYRLLNKMYIFFNIYIGKTQDELFKSKKYSTCTNFQNI